MHPHSVEWKHTYTQRKKDALIVSDSVKKTNSIYLLKCQVAFSLHLSICEKHEIPLQQYWFNCISNPAHWDHFKNMDLFLCNNLLLTIRTQVCDAIFACALCDRVCLRDCVSVALDSINGLNMRAKNAIFNSKSLIDHFAWRDANEMRNVSHCEWKKKWMWKKSTELKKSVDMPTTACVFVYDSKNHKSIT